MRVVKIIVKKTGLNTLPSIQVKTSRRILLRGIVLAIVISLPITLYDSWFRPSEFVALIMIALLFSVGIVYLVATRLAKGLAVLLALLFAVIIFVKVFPASSHKFELTIRNSSRQMVYVTISRLDKPGSKIFKIPARTAIAFNYIHGDPDKNKNIPCVLLIRDVNGVKMREHEIALRITPKRQVLFIHEGGGIMLEVDKN